MEITSAMQHYSHSLLNTYHDQAAVLSFNIYGWKQEDILLSIISVFCVYGRTDIMPISGFTFFQNKLVLHMILTTASSTAFSHTHRYNQLKTKVTKRGFSEIQYLFLSNI